MTPTRKPLVRLLLTVLIAGAALLGIAAPAQATASQGSSAKASAAAAACGIVRLHRALNVSRGGVDTVYGNWIGTDYSTGVLYPSRFGGFDQLAHFGVNLVPYSGCSSSTPTRSPARSGTTTPASPTTP